MTRTTPLGAVGTLAMDALLSLRYRRAGGTDSFRDEGLFQRTLPDSAAAFAAVTPRGGKS